MYLNIDLTDSGAPAISQKIMIHLPRPNTTYNKFCFALLFLCCCGQWHMASTGQFLATCCWYIKMCVITCSWRRVVNLIKIPSKRVQHLFLNDNFLVKTSSQYTNISQLRNREKMYFLHRISDPFFCILYFFYWALLSRKAAQRLCLWETWTCRGQEKPEKSHKINLRGRSN